MLAQEKSKLQDKPAKNSYVGGGIDQGSSQDPDLSEDDIPLIARLSLKSRPCAETEKGENSLPRNKKGGFVIPRKKKQVKELLQQQSFNSREGKELLRNVQLSLRAPVCWPTYKFEKVEFVYNEKLSREYREKKQAMRPEMRIAIEEKFAFTFSTSKTEIKEICEKGLVTGSSGITSLGDPKMGVYVCRYADIVYWRALSAGDSGYLIVYKILKGKVKTVSEPAYGSKDLLEPTPNYDCHVSKSLHNLPPKVLHSTLYDSSQYYFFEFADEGDELHVKRPRQVLPHAILTFSIGTAEGPQTVPGEIAAEVDVAPENKKSSSTVAGKETNKPVPNKKSVPLSSEVTSSQQVVWSGAVANKYKDVAKVNLISYARKKHRLPFNLGEQININSKISFEKLRPLLRYPLFRAGRPAITRVCKELLPGGQYTYYEVRPVDSKQDKLAKLVSHLEENNWAGVVQYAEGTQYMYLIPTSQLTIDLGITDDHSPPSLHALLFVKRERSYPLCQGKKISKDQKDGARDGRLSNRNKEEDEKEEEEHTQRRIQRLIRKHLKDKPNDRRTPKPSGLSPLMSKDVPWRETTRWEKRDLQTERNLKFTAVKPQEPLPTTEQPEFAKDISPEEQKSWQQKVLDYLTESFPKKGTKSVQGTDVTHGADVKTGSKITYEKMSCADVIHSQPSDHKSFADTTLQEQTLQPGRERNLEYYRDNEATCLLQVNSLPHSQDVPENVRLLNQHRPSEARVQSSEIYNSTNLSGLGAVLERTSPQFSEERLSENVHSQPFHKVHIQAIQKLVSNINYLKGIEERKKSSSPVPLSITETHTMEMQAPSATEHVEHTPSRRATDIQVPANFTPRMSPPPIPPPPPPPDNPYLIPVLPVLMQELAVASSVIPASPIAGSPAAMQGSAIAASLAAMQGSASATSPAVMQGSAIATSPAVMQGSAIAASPAVMQGSAIATSPAVMQGSAIATSPAVMQGSAIATSPAVMQGSAIATSPAVMQGSAIAASPNVMQGSVIAASPNVMQGASLASPTALQFSNQQQTQNFMLSPPCVKRCHLMPGSNLPSQVFNFPGNEASRSSSSSLYLPISSRNTNIIEVPTPIYPVTSPVTPVNSSEGAASQFAGSIPVSSSQKRAYTSPVTPKEYTVDFQAIPKNIHLGASSALQSHRNSGARSELLTSTAYEADDHYQTESPNESFPETDEMHLEFSKKKDQTYNQLDGISPEGMQRYKTVESEGYDPDMVVTSAGGIVTRRRLTEAERKGSNAVKEIFNILRRNADKENSSDMDSDNETPIDLSKETETEATEDEQQVNGEWQQEIKRKGDKTDCLNPGKVAEAAKGVHDVQDAKNHEDVGKTTPSESTLRNDGESIVENLLGLKNTDLIASPSNEHHVSKDKDDTDLTSESAMFQTTSSDNKMATKEVSENADQEQLKQLEDTGKGLGNYASGKNMNEVAGLKTSIRYKDSSFSLKNSSYESPVKSSLRSGLDVVENMLCVEEGNKPSLRQPVEEKQSTPRKPVRDGKSESSLLSDREQDASKGEFVVISTSKEESGRKEYEDRSSGNRTRKTRAVTEIHVGRKSSSMKTGSSKEHNDRKDDKPKLSPKSYSKRKGIEMDMVASPVKSSRRHDINDISDEEFRNHTRKEQSDETSEAKYSGLMSTVAHPNAGKSEQNREKRHTLPSKRSPSREYDSDYVRKNYYRERERESSWADLYKTEKKDLNKVSRLELRRSESPRPSSRHRGHLRHSSPERSRDSSRERSPESSHVRSRDSSQTESMPRRSRAVYQERPRDSSRERTRRLYERDSRELARPGTDMSGSPGSLSPRRYEDNTDFRESSLPDSIESYEQVQDLRDSAELEWLQRQNENEAGLDGDYTTSDFRECSISEADHSYDTEANDLSPRKMHWDMDRLVEHVTQPTNTASDISYLDNELKRGRDSPVDSPYYERELKRLCTDSGGSADELYHEGIRRRHDEMLPEDVYEPVSHNSSRSLSPVDHMYSRSPSPAFRTVSNNSSRGGSLKVTILQETTDFDEEERRVTTPGLNVDAVEADSYHHDQPRLSEWERVERELELERQEDFARPDIANSQERHSVCSPGTPETALPAEDFTHRNLGYWSSEYTTNKQRSASVIPQNTIPLEPVERPGSGLAGIGSDRGEDDRYPAYPRGDVDLEKKCHLVANDDHYLMPQSCDEGDSYERQRSVPETEAYPISPQKGSVGRYRESSPQRDRSCESPPHHQDGLQTTTMFSGECRKRQGRGEGWLSEREGNTGRVFGSERRTSRHNHRRKFDDEEELDLRYPLNNRKRQRRRIVTVRPVDSNQDYEQSGSTNVVLDHSLPRQTSKEQKSDRDDYILNDLNGDIYSPQSSDVDSLDFEESISERGYSNYLATCEEWMSSPTTDHIAFYTKADTEDWGSGGLTDSLRTSRECSRGLSEDYYFPSHSDQQAEWKSGYVDLLRRYNLDSLDADSLDFKESIPKRDSDFMTTYDDRVPSPCDGDFAPSIHKKRDTETWGSRDLTDSSRNSREYSMELSEEYNFPSHSIQQAEFKPGYVDVLKKSCLGSLERLGNLVDKPFRFDQISQETISMTVESFDQVVLNGLEMCRKQHLPLDVHNFNTMARESVNTRSPDNIDDSSPSSRNSCLSPSEIPSDLNSNCAPKTMAADIDLVPETQLIDPQLIASRDPRLQGRLRHHAVEALLVEQKRRTDERIDNAAIMEILKFALAKEMQAIGTYGTTGDCYSQEGLAPNHSKAGEQMKSMRSAPSKRQSYFFVYNSDNDQECESLKNYMLKTGAQYLDVRNIANLEKLTGELRVMIRRKNLPSVHRLGNLYKLKSLGCAKFACFSNVTDVIKKTRQYAAIFQSGGVLIPDDVVLRTCEPAYLEALLLLMAEQNRVHQKVYWVMNIRSLAYKKLGCCRPLTWRDSFVLDLLRKYRNEGYINIINRNYVTENVTSVQKYLDTALKQQLELMPVYRHFILLSDMNKQRPEIPWFLNRGIGFMDIEEYLHTFAGESKTRQLLSRCSYKPYDRVNDDNDTDPKPEGLQTPKDDSSVTTPASEFSESPRGTPSKSVAHNISPVATRPSAVRSTSMESEKPKLQKLSPHKMVSQSMTYYPEVSMKERRLRILSSIHNVKSNLMNQMDSSSKPANSKSMPSRRRDPRSVSRRNKDDRLQVCKESNVAQDVTSSSGRT